MSRVSRRDRRALMVGSAIVAAALLVVKGGPVVRRFYVEQHELALRARVRAEDGRRLLARTRELRTSTSAAGERWMKAEGRLFAATSVNVLTAQVSSYVALVARRAAVDVLSLQVRPDSTSRDGFRQATGRLAARSDVRGLASFLETLEQGPRNVRITSLNVAQSDPVGRPDQAERLTIEMAFQTTGIDRPGMNSPGASFKLMGSEAVRRSVVAKDPFRLDRMPSLVAFVLEEPPAPKGVPVRSAAVTPTLVLRGIIGPPWKALVEGIPGQALAAVVRAGDRYGDLRIQAVLRDSVIIRGSDTTWRLTLGRGWR